MVLRAECGVYVATHWNNPRLVEIRGQLTVAGLWSTSCWLDHAINGAAGEEKWTRETLIGFEGQVNAKHDFTDIRRSSAVLTLPDRQRGTGHHVELGYALALNKPVIAVGEPWSVFHSLAQWHDTLESAIEALVHLCTTQAKSSDAL